MKYFYGFVIIVIGIILVYSFLPSTSSKADYIQIVINKRQEIEQFMRHDPDSPFIKKGKVEFKGLKYFDIDPTFRVYATVKLLENPELITIAMSDGSQENYFRYAIASFDLVDESQTLTLLKSEKHWSENWVFLPFYDETSALETYGGGRYLNIDYNGESAMIIDFNLCYNPYCAYTDTYRCPFPPTENHITVAVKAGEKIYDEVH